MNHNLHTDFLTLVQDEEFVDAVREAKNADEFLKTLISKCPENENDIRNAFEFIRFTLSEQKKLNSKDQNDLLHGILAYASKSKTIVKSKGIKVFLWRAAVILILVSVSSVLFFQRFGTNELQKFAQLEEQETEQALIVLSDGSKKILESNNSYIEYVSNSGDVVVKNESTSEERIKNNTSSKKAELNKVVVPYGQRHKVKLSDGTEVQLNAGSKLVFPATFSGSSREVYLVGQGYFDVTHNEKVPFIVKTEHVDITVLGTEFGVSAYSDENVASAILVEGKVTVSQKDKMLGNDKFILSPGQGCFYDLHKQTSRVQDVNTYSYISWKDGLFQFDDMTLLSIVKRVKKYYNQSILIEGDELATTIVSGKLVLSNDFESVMKLLSKTIEGTYIKTEDNIYVLKY